MPDSTGRQGRPFQDHRETPSGAVARNIAAMDNTGTLFGWAFGDATREDDGKYVEELQREALDNARQTAEAKGLTVEAGSEVFTILNAHETLVELDSAPDSLVVRATVHVEGPGAGKLHAEGPMNG
jgi:hypothetical protein